jgi:hypothetical protein
MFDVIIVIGMDNSSAISTSKIMKITAIKKKRDEKGSRAEFFGSNPHSNGDLFSRSSLSRQFATFSFRGQLDRTG